MDAQKPPSDVTTAEPADGSTPKAVEPPAPAHRSFFRELPFLVVVAFGLALLIKFALVQAFFIPSGSMEHTLDIGDRVLVNKVVYDFRGPHRGEIVVFNGLDNFDENVTIAPPSNEFKRILRDVSGALGLGSPNEKDYIKRVIGVPGDRVMCCDAQGRVVVTPAGGGAAFALVEPYVFQNDTSDTRYFCAAGPGQKACPPGAQGLLVPKGRLWVMGDHRGDSADSRAHISDSHHGTVPENKVVGRAFVIVYPFGRATFLHVPQTFSAVAAPAGSLSIGLVGAVPLALLRRRPRSPVSSDPAAGRWWIGALTRVCAARCRCSQMAARASSDTSI